MIYRNPRFNSYGFLNTSERFAANYPEVVSRVVKVYEMVRRWAIRHPDEFELIYADESGISLPVAQLVMSRVDMTKSITGISELKSLKDAAQILLDENLVTKGTDMNKVIDELVDPGFMQGQ